MVRFSHTHTHNSSFQQVIYADVTAITDGPIGIVSSFTVFTLSLFLGNVVSSSPQRRFTGEWKKENEEQARKKRGDNLVPEEKFRDAQLARAGRSVVVVG